MNDQQTKDLEAACKVANDAKRKRDAARLARDEAYAVVAKLEAAQFTRDVVCAALEKAEAEYAEADQKVYEVMNAFPAGTAVPKHLEAL